MLKDKIQTPEENIFQPLSQLQQEDLLKQFNGLEKICGYQNPGDRLKVCGDQSLTPINE